MDVISLKAAGSAFLQTAISRLRTTKLILGGVVATLAFTIAGTSAASAEVRIVTLENLEAHRLVDAYEDADHDYKVVTRPVQNNDTQLWRMTSVGDNVYTLQQVSTGRYMDAYTSPSTADGYRWEVVTRTVQNDDTQKWRFIEVSSGVFEIKQVATDRYVINYASPFNDYELATTETAHGTSGQWRVTTVRTVPDLVIDPGRLPVGPGVLQPVPPAPPPPALHVQGSQNLPGGATLDLDTGMVDGPGGDIQFQLLFRQISPINGASLRVVGTANRDISDCLNMTYSSNPVRLADIPSSGAVCYQTNEGRIGELTINNVSLSLSVSFITWEQ